MKITKKETPTGNVGLKAWNKPALKQRDANKTNGGPVNGTAETPTSSANRSYKDGS